MNKIFLTCVLGVLIVACNSSDRRSAADEAKRKNDSLMAVRNANAMADSSNYTTIEWLDPSPQDLGKVKEGQIVEVAFQFKNTGNRPLIITHVSASCGCTTPETPEKPFAPGEKGIIRAKFDSQGKPGMNSKTVYVTANTKPSTDHQLNFNVEVTK